MAAATFLPVAPAYATRPATPRPATSLPTPPLRPSNTTLEVDHPPVTATVPLDIAQLIQAAVAEALVKAWVAAAAAASEKEVTMQRRLDAANAELLAQSMAAMGRSTQPKPAAAVAPGVAPTAPPVLPVADPALPRGPGVNGGKAGDGCSYKDAAAAPADDQEDRDIEAAKEASLRELASRYRAPTGLKRLSYWR